MNSSLPLLEAQRDDYLLSSDPARQDVDAVHAYLTRSYWAAGISRELVARAISNSVCFGLFSPDGAQVGLARFITDAATFAYLCDVYVLEEHRGRGLGRWLVEEALRHPAFTGLRRIVLITRDAHELYRRLGFNALARPEGYMEFHRPGLYQKQAG